MATEPRIRIPYTKFMIQQILEAIPIRNIGFVQISEFLYMKEVSLSVKYASSHYKSEVIWLFEAPWFISYNEAISAKYLNQRH